MSTTHLTIAFEDNLGHRAMSALTRRGYLWCKDTQHNRANAEALWPSIGAMRLALAGRLQRTTEALGTAMDSALEHHPEVTSLYISGFADQSSADQEAISRALRLTADPFAYSRDPTP